ncbi:MAG: hypothetical protein WD906_04025 [Anaerolineales bacterium]
MTAHPDLPELEVVPTQALRPHEEIEPGRVEPLIKSLRADRVLKNPPMVLPLKASDDYVVLDGANRVMAFGRMGIPHILVQIVRPDLHEVNVKSWNHALRGNSRTPLVSGLREIAGTHLVDGHVEESKVKPALRVLEPGGEQHSLYADSNTLEERVRVINEAAATFLDRYQIERTLSFAPLELQQVYPDLAGLIVYPHFTLQQVRRMAQEGWTFPAGLTRFIISPRTLHVNYPLEELTSAEPLATKRSRMRKWVAGQVDKREIRFYAESTFLFDE